MPFSLISHTWANFNEKKSADGSPAPRRGSIASARTGTKNPPLGQPGFAAGTALTTGQS